MSGMIPPQISTKPLMHSHFLAFVRVCESYSVAVYSYSTHGGGGGDDYTSKLLEIKCECSLLVGGDGQNLPGTVWSGQLSDYQTASESAAQLDFELS